MAEDDDFLWSRQTYSLKHFVRNFEHKLPVLVSVTQGYCGVDELLDISKGQIYIITDVKRQKRVVVQTANDLSLSIPVDYPLDFVVISDPQKKADSLETIIEQYDYGDEGDELYIVPNDSSRVSFACSDGADYKETVQFDSLQIIGDYDDIYLVAVPVNNGHVYQRKASIPVFVDINVAQAKGIRTTTNPNYFNQILANLHIEATSFHCSETAGNPEIMLYEGTVKQLSDYEYIEPQHYITCKQANAAREQRKAAENALLAKTNHVTASDAPIRPPKPDSTSLKLRRTVPEPPKMDIDVEDYEYPPSHNKPMKSTEFINQSKAPPCPPKPKPRHQPIGGEKDDRKYINIEHKVLIHPVAPMSKHRPDSQYAIAEQTARKQVAGSSTSEYDIEAVHTVNSDDDDDDAYEDVCISTVKPKVPRVPERRPSGKSTSVNEPKHIVPKPEPNIPKGDTFSKEGKPSAFQSVPKIKQNVSNPEGISHMSLSSIPTDITHLSKYEITDCLAALKLDKYADTFLEQDIDGDLLSTLTDEQMFVDEFQFKAFEARKIVKFIKGWRSNTQATTKL